MLSPRRRPCAPDAAIASRPSKAETRWSLLQGEIVGAAAALVHGAVEANWLTSSISGSAAPHRSISETTVVLDRATVSNTLMKVPKAWFHVGVGSRRRPWSPAQISFLVDTMSKSVMEGSPRRVLRRAAAPDGRRGGRGKVGDGAGNGSRCDGAPARPRAASTTDTTRAAGCIRKVTSEISQKVDLGEAADTRGTGVAASLGLEADRQGRRGHRRASAPAPRGPCRIIGEDAAAHEEAANITVSGSGRSARPGRDTQSILTPAALGGEWRERAVDRRQYREGEVLDAERDTRVR